jgi:hypothetical protein
MFLSRHLYCWPRVQHDYWSCTLRVRALLPLKALSPTRPRTRTDPRGTPGLGSNTGPLEKLRLFNPFLRFVPGPNPAHPLPRLGNKNSPPLSWEKSHRSCRRLARGESQSTEVTRRFRHPPAGDPSLPSPALLPLVAEASPHQR